MVRANPYQRRLAKSSALGKPRLVARSHIPARPNVVLMRSGEDLAGPTGLSCNMVAEVAHRNTEDTESVLDEIRVMNSYARVTGRAGIRRTPR
jgi:hypothetical protein